VKDTDIIESIMGKLSVPVGRHLYGVLGSYRALERFSSKLHEAKTLDGKPFPKPLSVNRGILDAIPDEEFKKLVQDEAKRPEPTTDHVKQAFESFLRSILRRDGLVILNNLEMLFAYNVDLNALRAMAADDFRIILLLPGRRESGKIFMFPGTGPITYNLPTNLIAEDHLWQLKD
jgi:hypothetical protein